MQPLSKSVSLSFVDAHFPVLFVSDVAGQILLSLCASLNGIEIHILLIRACLVIQQRAP